MKTLNTTLIILAIVSLFTFNFASSQDRGKQKHHPSSDKPGKPVNRISGLNKTFPVNNILNEQKIISPEEKNLMMKIKSARQSGNKQEMKRMQSQLNNIQGVVSKRGEQTGYIKKSENISRGFNQINISQVFFGDDVAAITTVTEQRGDNTGRIWTVVSRNEYGFSNYSETIFYYSNDNGINWYGYASAFNPYEFIADDAIDAEIIEDFSGTKYMYVTYGAITMSSGKYICNLITLDISGYVTGSVQRLEWPGFDYFNIDVNYYKPRITSDNAFWNGAPYVYIAACLDSSDGSDIYFGEKVAAALSPFNPNPFIDYKSDIYFSYSFNNPAFSGNCDIAWFDDPGNGGGSVMLVESGAYFTTALYLYETSDVGFLGLSAYEGYLDPDGLVKSSAYISSNGLYENLMIVNVNEYDVSDHDIQYFSTVDAGLNWSDGFVSYTFDDDYRADITGLRNEPGNFYSAHADFNLSFDNVFYSVARNDTWGALIVPLNNIDASVIASPRPGIRLGGNDSCFVVWTEWANNSNVWASSGCDGALNQVKSIYTGIIVEGFFNPSTFLMNRSDTITISLRNSVSPYNLVESGKTIMYTNGSSLINFIQIDNNTDYYIVINHRNSIETWSASTINLTGNYNYYYDFINSNSQAYGNNEIYLATDSASFVYYGIYSGDVNQDGAVDLADVTMIENDAFNFVSGYVVTDVNGDDVADLADQTIADNNAFNFVTKVTP